MAFNDTTSCNNAAGFVNGILRFKITEGFLLLPASMPYVGVGVGVEYLTSHTDLYVGGGAGPTAGRRISTSPRRRWSVSTTT